MSGLEKRISMLEETVKNHLIESGEIRADLKWLKKFLWFVLSSPLIVEAAKHVHLSGK